MKKEKKEYWLSVHWRSLPLESSPDIKVRVQRKNILHPICYPFVSWFHVSTEQLIIPEQRIMRQRVLREYMSLHPCFALSLGATRGCGPSQTIVCESWDRPSPVQALEKGFNSQQHEYLDSEWSHTIPNIMSSVCSVDNDGIKPGELWDLFWFCHQLALGNFRFPDIYILGRWEDARWFYHQSYNPLGRFYKAQPEMNH